MLITAGDLDTYTPLAIQVARGVRRDVAVINATMLSASWYAHPILARHRLNYDWANAHDLPSNESQHILNWLRQQALARRATRPIAFALTVSVDTTAAADGLRLAGPYWLVVPGKGATIDSSRVEASVSSAENLDWRGEVVSRSDRSPIHALADLVPSVCHSIRRARAGSTAVARCAGTKAAISPTSSRTAIAPPNAVGSPAPT